MKAPSSAQGRPPFRRRIYQLLLGFPLLLKVVQPVYRFVRMVTRQIPAELWHRALARFDPCPGTAERRDAIPPVIVSLTSYGARLGRVAVCLETLLRQTIKPDRIILWVAEDERESLPSALLRLQGRGLEIRACPDWKAYKKIVPTLLEAPEAVIVTADDDVFYPRRWLETLLQAHAEFPALIHCHQAVRIERAAPRELGSCDGWAQNQVMPDPQGFHVFPVGVGGTLYPPGSLHPDVTEQDQFMRLCPTADDIWLKAMSMRAGTICRQTGDFYDEYLALPRTQKMALFHANMISKENDTQLKAVFDAFDLYDLLSARDEQAAG